MGSCHAGTRPHTPYRSTGQGHLAPLLTGLFLTGGASAGRALPVLPATAPELLGWVMQLPDGGFVRAGAGPGAAAGIPR